MWQTDLQAIDFGVRRKQFLSRIKGGVAVLPSASRQLRNGDVYHSFRQDSNFYFLTGFEEPNSIALFCPQESEPFEMFVQPRDPAKELWDGRILGPEGAKKELGTRKVNPSSPDHYFDESLVRALLTADTVYYQVGRDPDFDRRMFSLMKVALKKLGRTGRSLWPIFDPSEILSEMRLFKTKAEIERLQNAAHITAEAHVNAMRVAKPGTYEYEVEAILSHAFRVHGASRLGYPSIVASGPNACVLHYRANRRQMKEGELLLIDAGAEFEYYTADITRVCPVGGIFSEAQREVYSSVLAAQKAAIQLARPGKTIKQIHEHTVEILIEELKRLKVLRGSTKSLMKNGGYRQYYPHRTSHWLGMDVHDAGRYYEGDYHNDRKLQSGQVFTIEPGLYFAPDSDAPSALKGIGVRIEDDILITARGAQVLTSGVPKEMDEVESLSSHA